MAERDFEFAHAAVEDEIVLLEWRTDGVEFLGMHAIDDQMHMVVVGVAVDGPGGLVVAVAKGFHHMAAGVLGLLGSGMFILLPVDGDVVDGVAVEPSLAAAGIGFGVADTGQGDGIGSAGFLVVPGVIPVQRVVVDVDVSAFQGLSFGQRTVPGCAQGVTQDILEALACGGMFQGDDFGEHGVLRRRVAAVRCRSSRTRQNLRRSSGVAQPLSFG